jgi:carbonic anhydrase/acetyltransferase-like protein (isoleucine patch superfamily)
MVLPKYKLLMDEPEYMIVLTDGRTLYRIVALRDMPHIGVMKGDFGGYVQSISNLDQKGSAWVYPDGMVFGYATVQGDAAVFDNAKVYGNANVYEEAQVFDNAMVYGSALARGNAQIYDNAQVYEEGRIRRMARIYGNARVFGEARVTDHAHVFGDARVHGEVLVDEDMVIDSGDIAHYEDVFLDFDEYEDTELPFAGNEERRNPREKYQVRAEFLARRG